MHISKLSFALAFATLGAALGLAIALTAAGPQPAPPPHPTATAPESKTNFSVFVRQPEVPQVFTGRTNYAGEPVTASCASCHATTTPDPMLRDAADLKQFHQGMSYNHGDLSCVSCHNPNNYDTLRLADGTPLPFPEVMQLCGQCHGPQARDFRNGAHGGMTGFWDLTRGPRQRNTCTDCHDPHSPAYPLVTPVFKPPPAERSHPARPETAAQRGKD